MAEETEAPSRTLWIVFERQSSPTSGKVGFNASKALLYVNQGTGRGVGFCHCVKEAICTAELCSEHTATLLPQIKTKRLFYVVIITAFTSFK